MGILINGVNGSFSGKVGKLVGSSWLGKSYIKSVPKKSNKLRSDKQLAQQAKFALANRLLHPVKDLLFTFRKQHKAATGYNLAIKHILEHAITGNYPDFDIDYSKIVYTQGNWAPAEGLEVLADGGNLLIIWDTNIYYTSSCEGDQICILIMEPETNTYFKGPAGIIRSTGMAIIPIPEAWRGKTLHTYVYCLSSHGKYSKSVYADPVRNH